MPFPDKPLAGLLLTTLLVLAVVFFSPAQELENGAGLNLLYALRGPRPAPESVTIITLDSRSARDLGQSPRPERWPRGLHARLVNGLAERGAKAIGFDVLFEREREPADDRALADALRRAGNVTLIEGITRESVTGPRGEVLASVDRLTQAQPLLRDAAWASGPFIMPKTPDGVIEFWSAVPSVGDRPSLPLLMARRMGHGNEGQHDGQRRILNLYGPIGSIRTIPYSTALELAADPAAGDAAFRGKAVLIGFSEFNQSRQADMFRTPYSTPDGLDISGVELCATALGNLLEDSSLERPPPAGMAAGVLAWGLLLALPWRLASTRQALAITVGLALGWLAVAYACFTWAHLWLPVILPAAIAPLIAMAGGLTLHMRAARQRERQLIRALDRGLSSQGNAKLAALLQGHDGGRTAHGVCLCSDIESYTSLSEGLSPEATRDTLNRYFAIFIPLVEAHGGHVMDIVGDSAMCLWLADDSAADACSRARAAALALHRCMNEGNTPGALKTRFGLHYGPVFLGEVGSDQHRELRVVGDIVNTSSRIQGGNKPLGTHILASAAVVSHGRDSTKHGYARALGAFALVGKRAPLELHEILPTPLAAGLTEAFETARTAYISDAPEAAVAHLQHVLEHLPNDGPARFYLQRCHDHLAGSALPDRDGHIVMTSK
ncbi:CHASE2 domain-containing protein [Zoogloea sp. LCSB751]|uniref:CHASE2 domain-containing protein n=1 Tax=Zoogloea sp. LCSB751 TaxID=1965277 RepID=UPI0009A5120E|nr:adenylate/guanylate cyclase domain-containing protein [Zoogloea sp. LCSB751]